MDTAWLSSHSPPAPNASLEMDHDQLKVDRQLSVLEYNRQLIALFAQFEQEEQDHPAASPHTLPSEFRNLAQYQSPATKRRLLSVTSLPTALQLEPKEA
ncbi:hypothetical protein BASA81_004744 [Batrachochytrium salamandrivorans]|nr:hypothetical protein BASA81_004744 [Batrachochytrium salamandrivorans]